MHTYLDSPARAADVAPGAAPPADRGRRLTWAVLVSAVVGVATVLRLLVAGPGLDRVWAEDGFVFLWDARREGLGSLDQVYAGYAHTLPRLFGIVGAQLPLEWFGAFAVLATALTAGVLAAVVHGVATRVTGSPLWALLPALALALTPAFSGSVGSLANLQWLLMVATFWCVIERPGRRWLPAAVALVASTTTPLTVLLLPAAWLAHRRDVVRSWPVRGLLAGLVVQGWALLFGEVSADNPVSRSIQLGDSLVSAVVTTVAGPGVPAIELGRFGVLDVSMLLGLAFAVVLGICLYATRVPRTLAVAAVLTGGLLYFATSILNGQPTTRYAATAAMFLLSALALAGPGLPRALRWTAVGIVAASVVVAFPASDFRMSGPSWTDQVARYEQSCAATGEPTPLELSPEGWGQIELYCPDGGG